MFIQNQPYNIFACNTTTLNWNRAYNKYDTINVLTKVFFATQKKIKDSHTGNI